MKIKRRTIVVLIRSFKIIGAVATVSILLYVYFATQVFSVTTFSFSGINKEDTEKIEQAIHTELAKKVLFVFPANKVLTTPSSHIKNSIKKLLPNTDVVKVYPSGLHTLSVEVVPYTPVFRLLDGKAIDARGIVYTEQHDISPLPLLVYSTTTSNPDALFLENISVFITKVNTMMFPVTRITIDDMGDVYFGQDSSSSTLMVRQDVDFKKAWSTLVSALDTSPLKTMMEKNKKNLEYIDLRFGNKVFYKFTNAVPVSIISSHNATSTSTTTSR